jgi:RNA polymerase sigma-70 factor (ECF subfamily)
MQAPDESKLIENARRDPAAFGDLYELHVDRIYTFILRRTGEQTLAEDITATTFESALRNFNSFEDRGHGLRPWLYGIARNALNAHFRKKRWLVPLEHAPAVNGYFEVDDPNKELSTALNSLSANDRELLTLRFFEELDSAEVAEVLGISKANVYLRLHRALNRLRQKLDTEEGVSNATQE